MPDDPASPTLRLTIQSDTMSVRAALKAIFGSHILGAVDAAERDAAELVMAEVLNNVVEHAQERAGSMIEVTVRRTPLGLDCMVVDGGRGMPGDEAPAGGLPDMSPDADLPEGGFGWHLIRLLATDLCYRRVGDRNQLSFRLFSGH